MSKLKLYIYQFKGEVTKTGWQNIEDLYSSSISNYGSQERKDLPGMSGVLTLLSLWHFSLRLLTETEEGLPHGQECRITAQLFPGYPLPAWCFETEWYTYFVCPCPVSYLAESCDLKGTTFIESERFGDT